MMITLLPEEYPFQQTKALCLKGAPTYRQAGSNHENNVFPSPAMGEGVIWVIFKLFGKRDSVFPSNYSIFLQKIPCSPYLPFR